MSHERASIGAQSTTQGAGYTGLEVNHAERGYASLVFKHAKRRDTCLVFEQAKRRDAGLVGERASYEDAVLCEKLHLSCPMLSYFSACIYIVCDFVFESDLVVVVYHVTLCACKIWFWQGDPGRFGCLLCLLVSSCRFGFESVFWIRFGSLATNIILYVRTQVYIRGREAKRKFDPDENLGWNFASLVFGIDNRTLAGILLLKKQVLFHILCILANMFISCDGRKLWNVYRKQW